MSSISTLLDNSNVTFPECGLIDMDNLFLHPEHIRLLQHSNGLYAYSGGIHLFGVGAELPIWHDLKKWNNPASWKKEYKMLFPELCFAETSLGDQFYYDEKGKIGRLEAETGYKQIIAKDFVDWVSVFSNSLEETTDVDILIDWCNSSGKNIEPGLHLCPLIPFCLGGTIEHHKDGYLCDAVYNMNYKGQLATQLLGLKPGDKVDLKALNLPDNIEFL